MKHEPRTCLLLALASASLFACTSQVDPEWACSTAQVPNGKVTSCSASALTIADGTYSGCPLNADDIPVCPPDVTPSDPSAGVGGSMGAAGAANGNTQGGTTGVGGSSSQDGSGESTGGKGDKEKGQDPDPGDAGSGKGAPDGAGAAGDKGGSNPSPGGGKGGKSGNDDWQCVVQNGVVECKKTECASGTEILQCGACVPASEWIPYDDCLPPETGGCWVTGGGYVVDANGNDSFGGNGMPMKDGRIRGEWEHVDHGTGNKLHGQVNYLYCRHVDEPGPGQPSGPKHDFDINQAYYGGPARWFSNGVWAEGYWFDIMAEDHGEPGNKPGPGNHGSAGPDYYHLRVLQMQSGTQSGTLIYETQGDFEGGNFQIHPPNGGHPYTSVSLPTWVELQP